MQKETRSDFKECNVEVRGLTAVPGLVVGIARLYTSGNINIDPEPVEDHQIPAETKKVEQARRSVGMDILKLSHFADEREDADTRDILQAQYQMLDDPELIASVERLIQEKKSRAEKAIYDVFQVYIDRIRSAEKSFLLSRLTDLRDVRDRLIHSMQQLSAIAAFGKDAIVVSEDVSPLEVVNFARNGIKGIVCNAGGLTAHASIIANAMGIPMIVGAKVITRLLKDGESIILDGNKGQVILRPDEDVLSLYGRTIKRLKEKEKLLRRVTDKPSQTLCGHKIILQANIDFEDEVLNIDKYRAEGIGLLRTDTLLMNSGVVAMDRKRQEEFCQIAFSGSGSAPVTIRLLDVGGDKVLDLKTREANPFLGWRGVRILLDRRELLRSQLEAICRVAGRFPGRTRLLIPMISNLDELLEVRSEFSAILEKLDNKGVPIDRGIQLGVMVEVPSVALQADVFAGHVDFFSIGTNDLIQYTLAVDRGNNLVASLYQPLHPGVLSLISMTVRAGSARNIPVRVCGEMASDPFAALVLAGLGIFDLSMTPRLIPGVKQAIRLHTLQEMKNLAEDIMKCRSFNETNELRFQWQKEFEFKLKKARKSE